MALAVGVGFAALTALSGTAAALLRWDDESEVHRPVFSNIPGPLQVMFYVATFVSFVAVGVLFAQRFRATSGARPTTAAPRPRTPSAAPPTSEPASTCRR